MSLEKCDSCYDIPGLRENYGNLLDKYEIYTGDSRNFPGDDVLGLIDLNLKEVRVRNGLKGKYFHVPVNVIYKTKDKNVVLKGYVPVHLFDFVHFHEFEHAENPEISENEINRRALEKYVQSYLKREIGSYIKNVHRTTRSYIV